MSTSPLTTIPQDLEDEITSLNSIYGSLTLTPLSTSSSSNPTQTTTSLILTLPHTPVSILILFPQTYPSTPPSIIRITHIHESLPKSHGTLILTEARQILQSLTSDSNNPTEEVETGNRAGTRNVILYDLIEALESRITKIQQQEQEQQQPQANPPPHHRPAEPTSPPFEPLLWTLSAPQIVHKSTFLGRACAISSRAQVLTALAGLVAGDRRAARASHNMWAYRVSASTALASTTVSTTSTSAAASAPTAAGVDVDQDYGDDGEDGAGVRLAGLLASMKVVGVLVVVSRWFGGVKLGSERWRCISGVGREAIVKGSEEGRWIVGLI